MKMRPLLLASGLLVACSAPSGDAGQHAPAAQPAPPPTATIPADAAAGATASAIGVVESVDIDARTITIAHGPVAALDWPAMTMTFRAPDVDLASIRRGDQVAFEFISVGNGSSITKLTRQQ